MINDFKALCNLIILSPLVCFSKKRTFEEICQCASFNLGLDEKFLFHQLSEREQIGSCVLRSNVAIPHVSVNSKQDNLCILAILNDPIEFQSIDSDRQMVNVVFSFFFNHKLNWQKSQLFLYELSELLNDDNLINSLLLSQNDPKKLNIILHKLDDKLKDRLDKNMEYNFE